MGDNFQDQLTELIDKWLLNGDDPASMISDLESEIARLRNTDNMVELKEEDFDDPDA